MTKHEYETTSARDYLDSTTFTSPIAPEGENWELANSTSVSHIVNCREVVTFFWLWRRLISQ